MIVSLGMTLLLAKERHKNAGRNDACPCGSGKKYKRCHLAEDSQAINAELASAAAAAKAAAELAEAEEAAAGEKTSKASKGAAASSKETSRGGFVKDKTSARASKGEKSKSLPRRGAV